ncbi:MAG: VPLPA-CTERM sorting domain-containing protein [Pseudomonadota bacterium]
MFFKTLTFVAALMGAATAASALTIEFDRNGSLPFTSSSYYEYGTPTNGNVYSSDGFDFSSTNTYTYILFPDRYGYATQSTSDALYGYMISVDRSDGGAFSLSQVDASGWSGNGNLNIVATGQTAGGGVVTETFNLGNNHPLTTLTFGSAWTGLSSVILDAQYVGGGATWFSIDNMVVDQVAPVPLPASALMLGAAIAGLSLVRRRNAG